MFAELGKSAGGRDIKDKELEKVESINGLSLHMFYTDSSYVIGHRTISVGYMVGSS